MSEMEMNRIARKQIMQYRAVLRYLKITGSGDWNKLGHILQMAFGLSPRTTHERLESILSAGIVQLNGLNWKYIQTDIDKDVEELLKCLDDGGRVVLIANNNEDEERMQYRAPQE
jgi:hypothetical protein